MTDPSRARPEVQTGRSATAGLDSLRSRELLDAREAHFARLRRIFAGERPPAPFQLMGVEGKGRADPYVEPERWTEEALTELAAQAEKLLDRRVFRPLVVSLYPYGVHFVDRMFGAETFELREKDNWQVRTLAAPVGELSPPDLDRDPTWALARRLAEAFARSGATVPLFGLPTIASALNVGMNLYGQELLVAMHDDPAAAHHDLGVINELLCRLHRWYLEHLPREQLQPVVAAGRTQPPGFGQLCGCSTQLLSPEMYRDCVAPLDDRLLAAYPHGGMIHLCGGHTQHIPVWRAMRSLRAVQLNDRAAEDLEAYFRGLREDQVMYVNPCPGMPAERIVEITGARRLVLVSERVLPESGHNS
jgi:hypothetical protein